jgi:hypothetical protein
MDLDDELLDSAHGSAAGIGERLGSRINMPRCWMNSNEAKGRCRLDGSANAR